jgi:hypothetical protein
MSSPGRTASRSCYYPRPIASLPDIVMIDIARPFSRGPPSLKRFSPIMVETLAEQAELDACLREKRDVAARPGLLDERPSTLPTEHLTIAHYAPPEPGWPFVQLCQWPADFAANLPAHRLFARGAYTFDLFLDRRRLETASRRLLRSLERRYALNLEVVFPDWSAPPDASPQ